MVRFPFLRFCGDPCAQESLSRDRQGGRAFLDFVVLLRFNVAMIFPRVWRWAGVFVAACTVAAFELKGAVIIAGPEEAGLRAAIAAAQPGDTVHMVNSVFLSNSVRIDKAITLYTEPSQNYRIFLHGDVDTELLQIGADGVVLDGLRLDGYYSRSDGVLAEKPLLLRDCMIQGCREPVRDAFRGSGGTLRLERVTISGNQEGLNVSRVEAKDSVFSYSQLDGISGYYAVLDGCRFEYNAINGAQIGNGQVRNCVFRYNGYYGLRCDPDLGVLSVSSSAFYANIRGGLFLGEKLTATVDNCTITRHTGGAAIEISQVHRALFRHCTIADNITMSEPGSWPPAPEGAFVTGNYNVELQNCIVADNPTNGSPHASGLIGEWIEGGGNIIGGPARLGVLQHNGGPTVSLMPLPDSPAIDAGRPSDVMVDARGLSRIAGPAPDAGAIEVGAEPPADTDADGLPDLWERLYGLNPTSATDASLDFDGDGHNALTEFNFRTDPRNPQSVHRIRLGDSTWPYNPGMQIIWSRVHGVEYQVETSTDLRTWRKIPPPYSPTFGGHSLNLVVPADAGTLFYRVTVVP
jgi:hypothetical protein